MSTRAQLVVEENEGVKIYKHCDGYPSGVLPLLKKFLPKFKAGRGWDPEYLTAHLSAALINEGFAQSRSMARRWRKDGRDASGLGAFSYTGHGLDSVWHGDIEFAYRIKADFSVEVYATPFDMRDLNGARLLRTWTLDELTKARKYE